MTRHRDVQNSVLGQLRARAFALLEVLVLGSAIIFAFGSSDRGHLATWMVILILVGVAYCLAATCLIVLPTRWQTTDWTVPMAERPDWCSCTPSVNECMETLLKQAKEGIARNNKILGWKSRLFMSMFIMLAVLIILAVIFWATLGG